MKLAAPFEFATAQKISFGAGRLREIGALAQTFGRSALVVTGRNIARADQLRELLRVANIATTIFSVPGEPTVDDIGRGVAAARGAEADLVIAFGGGSPIDAGKAIAAMLTNPGALEDYLEVVGRGQTLTAPPVPLIAAPTTAGTGAEVTRNAVLGATAHRLKVSLRSPLLLPRLALIDPELTYSLPRQETAWSGMDALTQLIEAFVCTRANAMTDALCREALPRAARALPLAFQNPNDASARSEMCLASLFSGFALANAGLGAVHGFAAPIGGMFSAPHGAVCACLLPHVMEQNIRALRVDSAESPALERYSEIASFLTGRRGAPPEAAVDWVRSLSAGLDIPALGKFQIGREAIPELVERSLKSSSMKGNPISLSAHQLSEALARAL